MIGGIRTVCVTGGAGFIGSHLVEALLARGCTVTVLDNLSTGRRENVPAAARLVEGDIRDDDAATTALEGCDAVCHLAARVAIRSSFEFAVEDAETNYAGTASVLRASAVVGGLRKVVTTSSMAVYADAPSASPIPETHPTVPVSPYGVSKLAAERLTHLMCERSGQESVVLRLFNTYGPRQAYSPYVGVVTIFTTKIRRGETPLVFGDGEQSRDFVHVADVVQGYLAALAADVSGETFNIGTGVSTSIRSVLQHVRRVLGAEGETAFAPAIPGELRYSIADISKAARRLGYAPTREFGSSIADVVREMAGV